jgi:hypothetical protein
MDITIKITTVHKINNIIIPTYTYKQPVQNLSLSSLKIQNSCVSIRTETALFYQDPCVFLSLLRAEKAMESSMYSVMNLTPVIKKPEVLATHIHL